MQQSASPHFPDAHFDVVAMAASAGGLKAMKQVLSRLPPHFPAALLFVQHLDPRYPSMMVDILRRHTLLQVKQAEAGEPLQPGSVFIAPPDFHLLVDASGRIALTQTGRVHYVRPSADTLFESVADSFGPRAIAVVLTGTGVDGSQGIREVHRRQGRVIAQSVDSSEFNGMPAAAIATGVVDYILPIETIAPALTDLVCTGQLNG